MRETPTRAGAGAGCRPHRIRQAGSGENEAAQCRGPGGRPVAVYHRGVSYRFQQPAPPPGFEQRPPRRWLPAAIIGAAVVIAAGLVGGALILKGSSAPKDSTCQAWKQTRLNLLAVPALPNGWAWNTPGIDNTISLQNAAVGNALDVFEGQITPEPADVAQAARQYVTARRSQMQALADHTYTGQVGDTVDTALNQLDQLCHIEGTGRPA